MIILDTHAWVWWNTNPGKLSNTARQAIDEADKVSLCPISCWEVAMLVSKGRLKLDRDVRIWVEQALPEEYITLVPISPSIAVTAGTLSDDFHGDPADRLIVATAIETKSSLITKDRGIHEFQGVDALW